ncbi:MAG: hypothetical protein ABIO00_04575 [Candidatus Paceibacterota bacterium]
MVGLGSPQMTYGSLSDSLFSNNRLVSFSTKEDADKFITQHPAICDEECVICQIQESDGKVEMIPV